MNTKEMVTNVRELVHEYQTDPISDSYIINRLNNAYVYAYNHFIKANYELFGIAEDLQITAGVHTYNLPENLFNKRLKVLAVPAPPNESTDPWSWQPVKKVTYEQALVYQTTRIRTYYPEVWCQLNNQVYIFPPPLQSYKAKLIVSRKIPMLGVYCGTITELRNNEIYLDELNDTQVEDNAGFNNSAFISVSDSDTGEVKAVYSYSAVTAATNKITLQTSPRKYAKAVIQDLTYTAVTAGTGAELINITYTTSVGVTEVVTVSGNAITVTMRNGGSTPAQIRSATIASAAASALVTVAVPTGTTAQIAQSAYYLIGGENELDGVEISELPGTQWGTIQVGDIVTYGYSTGASIYGRAFDDFLVDWAVMRVRGGINETDKETENALKLSLQELMGDTGGRPMGINIKMVERNYYGRKIMRNTR